MKQTSRFNPDTGLALLVAVAVLCGVMLSGCTTLNQWYNESAVDASAKYVVPSDKALVFVFRPSKTYGSAAVYTVKINGEDGFSLANGYYVPFVVVPGNVTLTAQNENWLQAKDVGTISFDAHAGKIYTIYSFLKGSLLKGGVPAFSPVHAASDIGAVQTACRGYPQPTLNRLPEKFRPTQLSLER